MTAPHPGPWRRKGWRVPGATHPACLSPCLSSGKLGPLSLRWVSFSSRETVGREPQAEPGERAAVATSGRGLAEPQGPRATAASLGAAADKRPPLAGTPGTCRPQTHSPESRGGRGGQGPRGTGLGPQVPEITSRQDPNGDLRGPEGWLIPAANACFSARVSRHLCPQDGHHHPPASDSEAWRGLAHL